MNDLLAMCRKTLEFEGNMQGTPDSCTINRALELCADAYQLGRKESDYEALRNQAALAAMQAQVSSFETMEKFVSILKERGDEKAEALEILVAMRSVAYADALIEELKKEKP